MAQYVPKLTRRNEPPAQPWDHVFSTSTAVPPALVPITVAAPSSMAWFGAKCKASTTGVITSSQYGGARKDPGMPSAQRHSAPRPAPKTALAINRRALRPCGYAGALPPARHVATSTGPIPPTRRTFVIHAARGDVCVRNMSTPLLFCGRLFRSPTLGAEEYGVRIHHFGSLIWCMMIIVAVLGL